MQGEEGAGQQEIWPWEGEVHEVQEEWTCSGKTNEDKKEDGKKNQMIKRGQSKDMKQQHTIYCRKWYDCRADKTTVL